MVALTPGATAPTLREKANARESEKRDGASNHPLVRKVLERFEGARIVDVRAAGEAPQPAVASGADDEIGYADSGVEDDDF
jgi:DNA polymerase-3 subunit gamma/tau